MQEILPNLYLSTYNQVLLGATAKATATAAIDDFFQVNCTKDLPMVCAEGIRMAVNDDPRDADTMLAELETVVMKIDEELAKQKKVVVHCLAAVSRSPSVVCAYLIWKNRISLNDAIKHVKAIRKEAFLFSMNFRDTLEKFESRFYEPPEKVQGPATSNYLRTTEKDLYLDLVKRLLRDRRVPADVEYADNPTDITDAIFNDAPNWDDDEWKFPCWNVDRFGMSCTTFDDKIIYIGGEHEDYYDPNFHIYNDVIVIDKYHNVRIYGYPATAFPPTDFHCAIRIKDHIWTIGCIGYSCSGSRIRHSRGLTIQVCRLHVPTMKMEVVKTSGDEPPWMDFRTCKRSANTNTCILQEDGTTIKITSGQGKFRWMFDTITCTFQYLNS